MCILWFVFIYYVINVIKMFCKFLIGNFATGTTKFAKYPRGSSYPGYFVGAWGRRSTESIFGW